VAAMEGLTKQLIDKYNSLLADLNIGHPLNKERVKELICMIHIMHFVGFDVENSKERLEILAYYA
jgi:hypothetical protein